MEYLKEQITHFKNNFYREGETVCFSASLQKGLFKRSYGGILVTNQRLIIYGDKTTKTFETIEIQEIKGLSFRYINGLDFHKILLNSKTIEYSMSDQEKSLELMTKIEEFRISPSYPLSSNQTFKLKNIVRMFQASLFNGAEYQAQLEYILGKPINLSKQLRFLGS